jgi:hypothetical protein
VHAAYFFALTFLQGVAAADPKSYMISICSKSSSLVRQMMYSFLLKISHVSRLTQQSATLHSGSESGGFRHSSMPRMSFSTSGLTHRSWPTVKVLDGLYVSNCV